MIGDKIIELGRVDSTNEYAKLRYSAAGFADGTVIVAREQTAGRGQGGNSWNSEPGKNLTCTICLKPRFLSPDRQFQLNKAIALGVLDFVRSVLQDATGIAEPPHPQPLPNRGGEQDATGIAEPPLPRPLSKEGGEMPVASIKWPNDIYAGDRKIGGILIENTIMGSVFESSFAGIGVNVNQVEFPANLPNPVSLMQILGHDTFLDDALHSLCFHLDKCYLGLKNHGPEALEREFNRNLLGFDQWRLFLQKGAGLEGKIKGVDQSGRLVLEIRTGEILHYSHKEIEYVL